jgi:hypothetical protein
MGHGIKNLGSERCREPDSMCNFMFLIYVWWLRAMSEAQYVSTGQIHGKAGLSHYGLGLEKYTHFTSPIRRYADVIVHRQLLLTSLPKKVPTLAPPPGFDRKAIHSLPESQTISIIRGEGIENGYKQEERTISTLVSPGETTRQQTTIDPSDDLRSIVTVDDEDNKELYDNKAVSIICDTINQQNRMAKLSSFECQGLFLSLYFKEQFEITQAVVTNLRSNGFWAYVPRFDFRAPVYLSDMNGALQIDPALLKLPPSSGLDPTAGFASSGVARRFPNGNCSLIESPDSGYLEAGVPNTKVKFILKILDVVTVNIFVDDWNTKSRVPQPRIHLIADSSSKRKTTILKDPRKGIVSAPPPSTSTSSGSHDRTKIGNLDQVSPAPSIYNELLKLDTPPILNVELRWQTKVVPTSQRSIGKSLIPGRIAFGGFVNPDTKIAQQEASILEASEAAMERRNQALANRTMQREYDSMTRIEKDVTTRMHRLAASKRNTRMSKGK